MQNRDTRDNASDADGRVGIGNWLSIRGKPSFTKERNSTDEQIQKWKSENCARSGNNQNMSAAAFLAEKYLGEKVVEKWSECMKEREGLQCFARRHASGIGFISSYRSFDRDLPIIGKRDFYAQHGASAPQYIDHDGKLYLGTKNYFIPRDPNADTYIALNAVRDGRIYLTCDVFVPKDEQEQTAPQADLIAPLLNREWCEANVPIAGGAILKFRKDRNKVSILSYWIAPPPIYVEGEPAYEIPKLGMQEVNYEVTFFSDDYIGFLPENAIPAPSGPAFFLQVIKRDGDQLSLWPGPSLGARKPEVTEKLLEQALRNPRFSMGPCTYGPIRR